MSRWARPRPSSAPRPSIPGWSPSPCPKAGPIEVVLVDAEPALAPLSAVDGSTDVYLVPAYRFTDETAAGSISPPWPTPPSRPRPPPTRAPSTPASRRWSPFPPRCPARSWSKTTAAAPPTPSSRAPTASPRIPSGSPTARSRCSASATTSTWSLEHCTYVELGGLVLELLGRRRGGQPRVPIGRRPPRAARSRSRSETEADFVGDAAGTKVGRSPANPRGDRLRLITGKGAARRSVAVGVATPGHGARPCIVAQRCSDNRARSTAERRPGSRNGANAHVREPEVRMPCLETLARFGAPGPAMRHPARRGLGLSLQRCETTCGEATVTRRGDTEHAAVPRRALVRGRR